MCVGAAVAVWLVTGAWVPPLAHRVGDIPDRSITARIEFPDESRIREEQDRARRTIECVYDHDGQQLSDLREALKGTVLRLMSAESFEQLDQEVLAALDGLLGGGPESTAGASPEQRPPAARDAARRQLFDRFRAALADDADLADFSAALVKSMSELDDYGLLEAPQHDLHEGRMTEILHPPPAGPCHAFARTHRQGPHQ